MVANPIAELLAHRWELYGFIRALVRNHQDAEDVFQSVAVAVVEQSARTPEIRDYRAWVKEVARRQVLKHFRTVRGQRTVALPVDALVEVACAAFSRDDPAPEDLVEEHEALRDCLEKLPLPATQLLRLRYLGSKSYAEIALDVDKREDAVRRAVSRARALLKDCVFKRLRLTSKEA